MASAERSEARSILRDILDESAQKRTDFASVIGCDDGLLGKKLNGTNGRDIGLGELELLDRSVQVQWFKRYGKLLGLEIRDVTAVELAEEFLAQLGDVMEMAKRMRKLTAIKGKDGMAQASLVREPARKAV